MSAQLSQPALLTKEDIEQFCADNGLKPVAAHINSSMTDSPIVCVKTDGNTVYVTLWSYPADHNDRVAFFALTGSRPAAWTRFGEQLVRFAKTFPDASIQLITWD